MCLLVELERLGLSSGAVEREHELRARPLTQRVRDGERGQLPHQECLTAEVEVGLDALLNRDQARLFQAADGLRREGLVDEVRQRGPAPQRKRVCQRRRQCRRLEARGRAHQRLESLGIDVTRVHAQHIPGRLREQHASAERLAQPGDIHLNARARRGRRLSRPDEIDQPVD